MRKESHHNYWLNIIDLEQAKMKIITGNPFDKDTEKDVERISKALDIKKTDTVLDFGCGIGRLLKPISKLCDGICGVDISEDMIRYGIEYCKGTTNIRFKAMQNVSSILLPPSQFDKIYSHIVLQHMYKADAFKVLTEFGRLLKIGGRVHLQYPYFRQESYIAHMVQRNQGGTITPLLEFYSEDELRFMFESIGFKIIEIKKIDNDFFVLAEKTKPTLIYNEMLFKPDEE